MPAATFEAFKAELVTLKDIVSATPKKTVRDESVRERIRNLFRTWVSTVYPTIDPFLQSKREFLKLNAELEALASLTSKYKRVSEYKKRLSRAIELANMLVLYLPPTTSLQDRLRPTGKDELFIPGIPDLPVKLVPNSLLGWKRQVAAFVNKHPFDQSVFIMIRYRERNRELIHRIKRTLSGHGFNGILAGDHNLTDDLYNPIACLLCCSKGLAVFDEAESRQVFNPNVAYELGMMHLMGRECRILKHRTLKVLHTDILMKLYLEYRSPEEAENLISTWLVNAD